MHMLVKNWFLVVVNNDMLQRCYISNQLLCLQGAWLSNVYCAIHRVAMK